MNPPTMYPTLPRIGKRSPLNQTYVRTLKRSYYCANLLLLIGITVVFGWIKYRQWQADRNTILIPGSPPQIIDITRFTPPPIDPGNYNVGVDPVIKPGAPIIGVPKPVPDAVAINQTMPDQGSITGQNVLPANLNVNDTNSVRIQAGDDFVPVPGTFVPVEVPAKLLSAVPPAYPEQAKILGQEGTVFINLLVDKDGSVRKVSVAKTSGFALLDSAAVQCGREWRFSSAIQNHKPIRIWVTAPVRFVLN